VPELLIIEQDLWDKGSARQKAIKSKADRQAEPACMSVNNARK